MEVIADTWAYLADPASWTGDGGILELLVQQLLLTGTALLLAVLSLSGAFTGCSTTLGYYWQAFDGQMALVREARLRKV